jgi:hypothetical protein
MSSFEEAVDERARATSEDIRRILGDLDPAKVFDILCQRPTVLDVKQALLWFSGDAAIFEQNDAVQSPAGKIMAVLTAGKQDDPKSH